MSQYLYTPPLCFDPCILDGLNSLELADTDTRIFVIDSMDESLPCSESAYDSIAHVPRECISDFPS